MTRSAQGRMCTPGREWGLIWLIMVGLNRLRGSWTTSARNPVPTLFASLRSAEQRIQMTD